MDKRTPRRRARVSASLSLLTLSVVVALAMTAPTAGAAGNGCEPGSYAIESWAISDGSGSAGAPATDSDVVVWADDRNGDFDIFAQDLESGEEWGVFVGDGDQTDPVVTGERVFWVDHGGEAPTVWTIDPEGEAAVQVSAGAADEVAAGDGLVAWTDRSGADADIVAHDLESGEAWTVCAAEGDQVAPAVSEEIVVWEDHRNGDQADIYASTPWGDGDLGEIAVCEARGDQTDPAAYGTVVLWADDRNGGSDIYGGDVAELAWREGGEEATARRCEEEGEFIVCEAEGDQVEPAIGGPLAYWTDLSGGEGEADIVGRDLTEGERFAVTDAEGPQTSAATGADGRLVVWRDAAGEVPVVVAGWLDWQEGDDGDEPGPVEEWTTDDVVTLFLSVFAGRGVFDEVRFAVDDGAFGEWQSLDDTEALELPPHDGVHTIHIQLANSGFEAGRPGSEDDPLEIDVTTTLDRRGPVTVAPLATTVRKGAVGVLKVKVRDALSPTADVKVRIKNRGGKVVKVVALGQRSTGKLVSKRFTADLKRGRYVYKVVASDLAGNRQIKAGSNTLTVR